MTTIVRGTTSKPVASERLAAFFITRPDLGGFLYIGYPIIGTSEGAYPIDALWIDPQRGLTIFNLVEGVEVGSFEEDQDDSYNKLESKLKTHRPLMRGRALGIKLNVVTFAPASSSPRRDEDGIHFLCNSQNLGQYIDGLPTATDDAYKPALEVIQSISTIRKSRKKRVAAKLGSRGERLKALEDSVANLDRLQGQAVIETVEGVQRIRGLAGSGKTIILALKAAYLHAQHPDWKIAVTFNTRSLKGQLRRLINTFFIEQTSEEPDWDNLNILQAWGAPGGSERNGLYYTFCREAGIPFLDFMNAKSHFGSGREFQGACEKALSEAKDVKPIYDAILVDEAQDFSPAFLRLCYRLLTEKKRLVYAYDELQSLSDTSLPSPEEIFGSNPDGSPVVTFRTNQDAGPRQDIILEKCYRNSRPVLATAHALGFGIYRTPPEGQGTGLLQMFDQASLWEEVGYKVLHGALKDNSSVTLARTEESSPLFLETHSPIDDLIQFHVFDTQEAQANWLVESIKINLRDDELEPEDIVIINPDPFKTRDAVGLPRKLLFDADIDSHLAGVDTSPDVFFTEDSVAFTGIFRAKGNEAGMVYIFNAQDCVGALGNSARMRNQLFTAITRSRAWVRVVGVGPQMSVLIQEFERIKKADFKLKFRYPTAAERSRLNIVNRDMTKEEERGVKKGTTEFSNFVAKLASGSMFLEDLPANELAFLREFLKSKRDDHSEDGNQ